MKVCLQHIYRILAYFLLDVLGEFLSLYIVTYVVLNLHKKVATIKLISSSKHSSTCQDAIEQEKFTVVA